MTQPVRCAWVTDDPVYQRYHDEEWGRPVRNERQLFEQLTLEGAQAGLSWLTILRKREGYRNAFANFDPRRVAGFDSGKVDLLVQDAGIVRHRGKIEATVNNARRLLALWEQGSSLEALTWGAYDNAPQTNSPRTLNDIPTQTTQSVVLSKTLKKLGFRFVGPTTVYAYLQATGVVNDHETGCFCHPDKAGNTSTVSAGRTRET